MLKGDKNQGQKEFVRQATQDADIYEVDMFYNKDEAAWYGFNYYDGIADCYKKTEKDPYYNPASKKRSSRYLRVEWLYEKI